MSEWIADVQGKPRNSGSTQGAEMRQDLPTIPPEEKKLQKNTTPARTLTDTSAS